MLGGKLEWGQMHKDKFWKENVKKFERNDFDLIKKLINLLNNE